MTRQLDLVTRVPCRADYFTIQGDRLYTGARYGDSHAMTIFDIADVTAPRVLGALACRRQVPSVAVAGDVAFVGEYHRSILAVDVRDPARPKPFDALVSFRKELAHFSIHDGILVAAAGTRGVFALDVRDPWKMRLLPALAIAGTGDDEPDVEQLAMRDGVIYAAVRNLGCVVVEIVDGALRERGRIVSKGFNPSHVIATAKCLWMFGSCDEDDVDLVVADRATGEIRHRGKSGISHPQTVVDAPGGGVGLHTHYTGSVFLDDETRIERRFRQYEYRDDKSYVETHFAPPEPDDDSDGDGDDDDDGGDQGEREVFEGPDDRRRSCLESCDWIVRHRDHLLAVHGREELIVWKPRPDSVFG